MADVPKTVDIHEEGPREGFQIEEGPIAAADKVRFIEALAETGLKEVQCVSFVDPRRVPGQRVEELGQRRGIRQVAAIRRVLALAAVAHALDAQSVTGRPWWAPNR